MDLADARREGVHLGSKARRVAGARREGTGSRAVSGQSVRCRDSRRVRQEPAGGLVAAGRSTQNITPPGTLDTP